MTVATTTNRVQTDGDGATTAFPTTGFIFFLDAELEVYLVDTTVTPNTETLKTITTHYTVSGGSGSTGSVEMIVAPTSDEKLLIVRVLPLTQAVDLVNNDASDAEVVEDVFDRGVMMAQQLDEQLSRAVQLPISSTVTGITIPEPASLLHLRWNTAGDALENVDVNTLDPILMQIPLNPGDDDKILTASGGNFLWDTYKSNVIAERTSAAGVTVDGVLLKDGGVVLADGAAIDADTINEATAGAGVTIAHAITNTTGHTFQAGDMIYSWGATRTGFLLVRGQTLGNAASGATEASAAYDDLFAFLWDSLADGQAAVSTGRGANAAADFAANKTITIPDKRGRVSMGADNMGGSSANVVADTEADTLGDVSGEDLHTQTGTEVATHAHPDVIKSTGNNSLAIGSSDGSPGNSGNSGSSTPFNIMQPYMTENCFIRY